AWRDASLEPASGDHRPFGRSRDLAGPAAARPTADPRSGCKLSPHMSASLSTILAGARVIDMTHPLTADFPLFPAYDPVRVAEKFSCARDGFFVKSWAFDEHSGTHVDAPAHFGEGAATVDRIAPEELILPVAVIGIGERVEHDHDATAMPDDVLRWERRHGRLPDRCAVFVLT